MEFFVPVMLFILGVHPDKPGEPDIQRPEILFASAAECEEAGAKMAKRMTQAAQDKSGARYEHRCMSAPSPAEYEAAFAQLSKSGE